MNYAKVINGDINHQGEVFKCGDIIEIDNTFNEDELNRLLDLEVIEPIEFSSSKEFSKMTVKELREVCKKRGIENYSDLKKQELINALNGEIENDDTLNLDELDFSELKEIANTEGVIFDEDITEDGLRDLLYEALTE